MINLWKHESIDEYLEFTMNDLQGIQTKTQQALGAIQNIKNFGGADKNTGLMAISMLNAIKELIETTIQEETVSLLAMKSSKPSAREAAVAAGVSPATIKDWVTTAVEVDLDEDN